jgi:Lar family restriction alleviation protein
MIIEGIELRPCPFCGSGNMELCEETSDVERAYVFCSSCHAQGPDMNRDVARSEYKNAAARAWNCSGFYDAFLETFRVQEEDEEQAE